jgi:hypothetical protein
LDDFAEKGGAEAIVEAIKQTDQPEIVEAGLKVL